LNELKVSLNGWKNKEKEDNTVYEIIAPCGMLRFIY
jgi:hypothetical protein